MSKKIIASGEYLINIPKGDIDGSGNIKIQEYSNEVTKDTKSWYYGTREDIEPILRCLPALPNIEVEEIIWVNTEEFKIETTDVAIYSLIYSKIQSGTITHKFCKNLLNL